jgi:hypothetical protein
VALCVEDCTEPLSSRVMNDVSISLKFMRRVVGYEVDHVLVVTMRLVTKGSLLHLWAPTPATLQSRLIADIGTPLKRPHSRVATIAARCRLLFFGATRHPYSLPAAQYLSLSFCVQSSTWLDQSLSLSQTPSTTPSKKQPTI